MTEAKIIDKNNYWAYSTRVDDGFDIVERRHFRSVPERVADVYPGYWILYVYEKLPSGTFVGTGQDIVELTAGMAVLVPPFQVVEWNFPAGWGEWKAYCVHRDLESFVPHSVSTFVWDPAWQVESYADLADILMACFYKMKLLGSSDRESVVQTIRSLLNQNFREDLRIDDFYKDLRTPASSANFWMRKAVGMPAVYYRNKLRVFEALRLLALGNKPMDVCYKAGFKDYSRFYRQFCSNLSVPPSDYSPRCHDTNNLHF